jgi:hypothetical protein
MARPVKWGHKVRPVHPGRKAKPVPWAVRVPKATKATKAIQGKALLVPKVNVARRGQ